ncbi:reverse transcriptase [Gossypium australe]|uniref:Reverse transcriptase n=1 Tax=Gossypium australe TaxID=47621 RepID=A0A5B6UZL7_9ROSI|nr:reverse transcriptase [Gossypium australe]
MDVLNGAKKNGGKCSMALKLDMSKDNNHMHFAISWVELIMRCISSISYPVVINGKVGQRFQPIRGLKKGDPLSPYLFLIYSEDLSALMRFARQEGLLEGARICRRSPKTSHLLFADDCILFDEASKNGANVLKAILKEYEEVLGQCVDYEISMMFYNSNMFDQVSNVCNSKNLKRYLGLPNMVGRRKKITFQILKDRMESKINSWSTKHGKRGINWSEWRNLCELKENRGIGFHCLTKFNLSLLSKQAKYYPTTNFLKASLGNIPSFT